MSWMMLAACEVVQYSTGFSSNDVVFGHKVCGLLPVFQDIGKAEESQKKSYVLGFKNRLAQTRELAKVNLQKCQQNIKRLYCGVGGV